MTWTYAQLQTKVGQWLARTDLGSQIPDFIYLAEQRIMRRQEWFLETYMIANSGIPLPIDRNPYQLPDYVRQVKGLWAASGSYRHPIELVTEADYHERMATSMSGTWNTPMPGIPTIAVIRPQMSTFMQQGSTGVGPWVSFWPVPQTGFGYGAAATATLSGTGVLSIAVTSGGAQYSRTSPPTITFLNNDAGTGAAATADVNNSGRVDFVFVTAAGSGYTTAPSVIFSSFAIDLEYVRDLTPISTTPNQLFLLHPDLYLYGALLEAEPYLQHDERVPMWESRYEQILSEIEKERERAKLGANPKRARLARVF